MQATDQLAMPPVNPSSLSTRPLSPYANKPGLAFINRPWEKPAAKRWVIREVAKPLLG